MASGELENDDMGSLFEGMVLFTTPAAVTGVSDSSERNTTDKGQTFEEAHQPHPAATNDSLSASAPPAPPSPLDENLFADLNLIMVENPQEKEKEGILEEDHHRSSSSTLQISLSRKKKRAAGLRIGYGRDDRVRDQDDVSDASHQQLKQQNNDHNHPPFPIESHDAPAATTTTPSSSRTQFQDENENEVEPAISKHNTGTGTIEIRFEEIRALIDQKLNSARQAVSYVSSARKDSIRKRRKAAQLLSEATAKYSELEKQLEEACEAEDFEKAEWVGENLASADKERELLLLSLRDAEAHSDALESKMGEAVESQIQTEEECASLLQKFSLVSCSAHPITQLHEQIYGKINVSF